MPGLNSVPSCGWPAHVGAGRAGAARPSWPSLLLPQISHIIREIRQFQQASYRIDHQPKVTQYLLDKALVIDEETLYELSLKIEPRLPA